ncbi:MAG: PAS domain S-box protein [Methanobacteriaceae archaeon]
MKNKELKTQGDEEFIHKESERIKQLELDLKEIKYKFNEAEAIAKFGFWEVDPATLNPTWTEGLFKIVGYDHGYGQVKYFDQKKFIHPEDWEYFYGALQSVLKTGEDLAIDVRVVRPDGSIRIIHLIAKPKNDKNGKVIGVRGTAQDITYLKKIENDLRKSEAYYRTLFENTGTATIVADEDYTILMANSQFEKLSGYSKDELEGEKSWKEMVSKDNLEMMEEYHHLRINDLETPPEHYEARLVDKEGNIRIILINVAIIPGTKKTIAYILDLTESKNMEKELANSERRYRYLVEKASAGMFILDKNGVITYLNDHLAQILGYAKDEMLGNHIKYFADEKDEFFRPRKPFEVQIERYNWFKFLNKAGNVFWTNLAISPIFNSKNEYIGLLGIVSDINVQKGLEEAFLEREEIFTEIIYDMMGMLNNITKDLNKSELVQKDLTSAKNLDNN